MIEKTPFINISTASDVEYYNKMCLDNLSDEF